MKVHFHWKLADPNSLYPEVNTKIVLYFTNTFFLVICSFFGVDMTPAPYNITRALLNTDISYFSIET